MNDEEFDFPDSYECSNCGYTEYWCELCGYHGHDCETGEAYV